MHAHYQTAFEGVSESQALCAEAFARRCHSLSPFRPIARRSKAVHIDKQQGDIDMAFRTCSFLAGAAAVVITAAALLACGGSDDAVAAATGQASLEVHAQLDAGGVGGITQMPDGGW
jgi:hypothetical protein